MGVIMKTHSVSVIVIAGVWMLISACAVHDPIGEPLVKSRRQPAELQSPQDEVRQLEQNEQFEQLKRDQRTGELQYQIDQFKYGQKDSPSERPDFNRAQRELDQLKAKQQLERLQTELRMDQIQREKNQFRRQEQIRELQQQQQMDFLRDQQRRFEMQQQLDQIQRPK